MILATRRSFLLGSSGLLAATALAACGTAGGTANFSSDAPAASSKGFTGTLIDPAAPRPQFTLTDTSGAAFDFRARTGGRATLLFFGYTMCPDICTPTMADLQAALQIADPKVRSQVDVVFVTTDPKRDTGPVLRAWLDGFNSAFIGLTGTDAELLAAQDAVGVPVAEPGPDDTFGHAAQVTAWATDDLNRTVYLAGTAPRDIAHDLPLLVKPPKS